MSEFTPEGVRDYERRRYSHFDQKLIDWLEHRVVSRFVAELFSRSGVAAEKAVVLDVPSGYGRFTHQLVDRGGRVVAVDLSAAMVERARQRAGGRGVYCVADLRRLPFRDAAFDAVLVIRLLQHLDAAARAAALAEVVRVSSGWAVLTVYARTPLHTLVRRLQGRHPKGAGWSELVEQLRGAGLEVVRCRTLLPLLHAQRVLLVRKAGAPPP